MIRRELTEDIKYTGYMVGDEPIKTTAFTKRIYFLGVKMFEHTYNSIEILEETGKQSKKSIGFEKQ